MFKKWAFMVEIISILKGVNTFLICRKNTKKRMKMT